MIQTLNNPKNRKYHLFIVLVPLAAFVIFQLMHIFFNPQTAGYPTRLEAFPLLIALIVTSINNEPHAKVTEFKRGAIVTFICAVLDIIYQVSMHGTVIGLYVYPLIFGLYTLVLVLSHLIPKMPGYDRAVAGLDRIKYVAHKVIHFPPIYYSLIAILIMAGLIGVYFGFFH